MDGRIAKDAAAETLVAAAPEGKLTERQAERQAGFESSLLKLVLLVDEWTLVLLKQRLK